MTPDPSFKALGIISISLTWLGLLLLVYKWRGNKTMSFSLHAAQSKGGQVYYFLLFAITLPLFYLFVAKWYVPALKLPNLFRYIVIIGIAGQLVAVIVPAVSGLKEKIHNTGAYLMASTLIPSSVLVAVTELPTIIKIFAFMGIAYMISVWFLHFILKRLRPHYLYFQAAYVAIFHLIILASTYVI